MKKTNILILIVTFIAWFCVVSYAADAPPKPVKVPGGEYTLVDDALILSLDYPLANNRDTIVGNYVQGPGGQKLNMDAEKDLIDFAKSLREQLLGIKTATGMGALRSVIVQYNTIILTRYPRVDWAIVLGPLEAQLAAIAKEKKLPAPGKK